MTEKETEGQKMQDWTISDVIALVKFVNQLVSYSPVLQIPPRDFVRRFSSLALSVLYLKRCLHYDTRTAYMYAVQAYGVHVS